MGKLPDILCSFDISNNKWIDNACLNIEPNKNSDDISIEILKHKIRLSEIDINKKNDEIKHKNKIAEIIKKSVSKKDSNKIIDELKKEGLIEDISKESNNCINRNMDNNIRKIYKGNKYE